MFASAKGSSGRFSRRLFWGLLLLLVLAVLSPNFAWLVVDTPPKKLFHEILLPAVATVGLLLSSDLPEVRR